jgi:hypothetical protein
MISLLFLLLLVFLLPVITLAAILPFVAQMSNFIAPDCAKTLDMLMKRKRVQK